MQRPLFQLALGILAPLLLYSCGQTANPQAAGGALPPGSPYANGAAYPWSDRLDAPVADPYAAGRDYPWTSPVAASAMGAQGLSSGVNILSELPWTSASSGWGPIERNRSNGEQGENDGKTLTIGGQTFLKGLGVHADSDVRFALNGQCASFSASVGIDDEVGPLGRVSFQVIGDGAVLFDSGELGGTDAARAVTVGTAGVRELQLRVLGGADGYYDHADWADAKVTCTTLKPSGSVYVSDLAYTSATSGWGPVELDRSNGEQAQFDGRALTIGGQVFAKGLGVHSDSAITYDIGGACQVFTSVLGVDDETNIDEANKRGSVVFQVYGDGRLLYESPVLPGYYGTNPVRATADLTGVQTLQLVVTDAGDGKNFDHADWADAKLSCASAGTPGSLDPSFGVRGHASTGGVDSVVEPDGAVVLLGADFSVRRLSAAGQVSGTGTASVAGGTAYALARQSNGNLVAVGDQGNAVVAVRYLKTLQPDPTFGTNGVKVIQLGEVVQVGFPGNYSNIPPQSQARNVSVQPDGKIVVVGSVSAPFLNPQNSEISATPDHLVARLNTDGTRDPSFGTNGTFSLGTLAEGYDCGGLDQGDVMSSVAVQADGKIVAGGNSDCVGYAVGMVLRLTASGQLDSGFSGNGVVLLAQSSYGAQIRALVLQPDGKIVIGGATARFHVQAFVERLTPAGTPDGGMTFQIADSFFEPGFITSLALQADGKVVFGASSTNNLNLGRLKANLTLDTTFGSLGTGYVVVQPGITSVNVDAANRIVGSNTVDTVRVLP